MDLAQRYQNDAAHRWLRNQINAVAATMNGMSNNQSDYHS